MSDIQRKNSASNVGTVLLPRLSRNLAALKVELEYARKRARLQEEQARLQEERTLQQIRTESDMQILSAEEEVAVAEAEILAEDERLVQGSLVRSNIAGHPSQSHQLPSQDPVASFETNRDITNHMPPAAHSSPVRSARVSPVRHPTAGSSPSRHMAGAPAAEPARVDQHQLVIVQSSRPRTSIDFQRPEPFSVSSVRDPSGAASHPSVDCSSTSRLSTQVVSPRYSKTSTSRLSKQDYLPLRFQFSTAILDPFNVSSQRSRSLSKRTPMTPAPASTCSSTILLARQDRSSKIASSMDLNRAIPWLSTS